MHQAAEEWEEGTPPVLTPVGWVAGVIQLRGGRVAYPDGERGLVPVGGKLHWKAKEEVGTGGLGTTPILASEPSTHPAVPPASSPTCVSRVGVVEGVGVGDELQLAVEVVQVGACQ